MFVFSCCVCQMTASPMYLVQLPCKSVCKGLGYIYVIRPCQWQMQSPALTPVSL